MKFEHVKCNVCGSDNTKSLGKRRSPNGDSALETNIVECISCGLMYPNPMPNFQGQDIQDNYSKPEEYFSEDARKRLEPFKNTLDAIEKAKPEKGRLLDVGCGRGEFLYVARDNGWEVVGTDISNVFVDYAKREFKINALAGDLQDLDLPAESFDAVCMNSVIQCVQDPAKTLSKIYSLLKKEGVLYIETTNDDALVFQLGDFFKSMKEGRRITTHLSPLFPCYQLYGFNKKSLSAALKAAGFEVSYIKVGGKIGGGKVEGDNFANAILNLIRKITIYIGGLTGKGHLLFCVARKTGAK
ncbi:class I SAM-dependent methyltransferase [Candidatus Omnitrophota bacterium]